MGAGGDGIGGQGGQMAVGGMAVTAGVGGAMGVCGEEVISIPFMHSGSQISVKTRKKYFLLLY